MTDPKHTEPVDLLPCPFCGAGFKMGQEPHDNFPVGGMFYIYHDYGPLGSPARSCRIEVSGHFDTEAEAIAAWNTRTAAEAASRQEVERLREALEGVATFLETAPLESGVCCCGDPIEGHGYHSGHSPVDQASYTAMLWAKDIRAALTASEGGEA